MQFWKRVCTTIGKTYVKFSLFGQVVHEEVSFKEKRRSKAKY